MGELPEKSHTISQADSEQTLAAWMRALYGDAAIPWAKAKAWIQSGKVSVDGELSFDPALRPKTGQCIRVVPSATKRTGAPLPSAEIVFVDAEVVVVRKPAGLETCPFEPGAQARRLMRGRNGKERDDAKPEVDGPGAADTLLARTNVALRARAATGVRKSGPAPSEQKLGVVSRLDKDTTGLVVFARTRRAREVLEQQFRTHDVERRYLALAHGLVSPATIESLLVPNRGDGIRGSWRGQGKPPPNAKSARTHIAVEEILASGHTYVSCTLETGKQHQIRIHLAEQGHPLIGERIYIRDYEGECVNAPRPMLHAATLGFRHPTTERWLQFVDPVPSDFAALLDTLRQGHHARATKPR